MRRFICITMVLLFFAAVITGFAEAHVHPGSSGIHVFLAVLFVAFTVAHAALNRKALARNLIGTVRSAE